MADPTPLDIARLNRYAAERRAARAAGKMGDLVREAEEARPTEPTPATIDGGDAVDMGAQVLEAEQARLAADPGPTPLEQAVADASTDEAPAPAKKAPAKKAAKKAPAKRAATTKES